MANNCFIHVVDPSGTEYDVGPFEAVRNHIPSEDTTAVEWIYHQIGRIKINNPDAELIKHSWYCSDKESLMNGPEFKICVELAGYRMDVKPIRHPRYTNLNSEALSESDGK